MRKGEGKEELPWEGVRLMAMFESLTWSSPILPAIAGEDYSSPIVGPTGFLEGRGWWLILPGLVQLLLWEPGNTESGRMLER